MLNIKSAILLCLFAKLSLADYCQDNFTIGDFPQGVLADIVNLFTKGALSSVVGCYNTPAVDPDKIRLWLWTNDDPNTPSILNHQKPVGLHANQPIIFILHGWLCNVTSDRMPQLKDAYLKRYAGANVIGVEWTTYSVDLYANSFCAVPKIAHILGEFICNLNVNYDVDIKSIHIVGHSLGGQISGLTGQEVQLLCHKKIFRITGLDPAGPLFQMLPIDRRLDASDATIVDVIHTNQILAGFYGPCGTADYFPNCGYHQPGCETLPMGLNATDLLDKPLSLIGCSHLRSIDYFIESISSDKFVGQSCEGCPGMPFVGPCIGDFFRASSSVMGEDYPDQGGIGKKFFVQTNSKAPFAKGT